MLFIPINQTDSSSIPSIFPFTLYSRLSPQDSSLLSLSFPFSCVVSISRFPMLSLHFSSIFDATNHGLCQLYLSLWPIVWGCMLTCLALSDCAICLYPSVLCFSAIVLAVLGFSSIHINGHLNRMRRCVCLCAMRMCVLSLRGWLVVTVMSKRALFSFCVLVFSAHSAFVCIGIGGLYVGLWVHSVPHGFVYAFLRFVH